MLPNEIRMALLITGSRRPRVCIVWALALAFAMTALGAHASPPQVDGDTSSEAPVAGEPSVDKPVSSDSTADVDPEARYRTIRVKGQVVWVADALKDHFGISTVPEARESVLGIWTDDKHLHPIVENIRGRAFRKDDRLRGKEMELLIRKYDRQPMVQILRVYLREDKNLYEVDYWCDVCAIVMFETGPCACCQDHNRLRMRRVDADGMTTGEEKGLAPDESASDQNPAE